MKYKYAVVIPTCGKFSLIEKHFPRYAEFCNEETIIILSVNPKDKEEGERSVKFAQKIIEVINNAYDKSAPDLDYIMADEPIGFSKAVNNGLSFLKKKYGFPENIVIANDDLLVTDKWLNYLRRSLKSKFITTTQRMMQDLNPIRLKDICPKSKIGLTGPVSYGASGEQYIVNEKKLEELGLDVFSAKWHESNLGLTCITKYISGYCMMISRECLEDLWIEKCNGIFDDRFKIGGFEDNDLCIRASKRGWISTIATDCYIGHEVSSTIKDFGNTNHGLENFFEFYKKYEKETQRYQKVVACYRVSIKNVNEIVQFKSSLIRAAKLLDGISVLLTNNPAECLASYDAQLVSRLEPRDQKFVEECYNCQDGETFKKDLTNAIKSWIEDTIKERQQSYELLEKDEKNKFGILNFNVPVNCDVWLGEFNERDERNYSHKLAEDLEPDWIMSIDADEVIEDRITNKLIQKWTRHPNVFASLFTVSFLNHWENMQLLRQDPPFNNMSGPRLWRVDKGYPQKIVAGSINGLHCGNSPEYGQYCTRVSSIRMRHLSHVREVDRMHKYKFYTEIDKEKDPKLVGYNDYSHIIRKNIPVSTYNPNNGIALCMLSYKDDEVLHINRWIEESHFIFDRKIIVWTAEWLKDDMEWLDQDLSEMRSKEEWYKTGPSWEFAYISKLYGIEVLHHLFDESVGLAECRNKAIDHLLDTNDGTISWVTVLDPDEFTQNTFEWCNTIRKCSENNDAVAFVFKFKNPLNTFNERGERYVSTSDSLRMFRLSKEIKFSGLVHETISDSINKLKSKGKAVVLDFPVVMTNTGLMNNSNEMAKKLKKYSKLLEKALHQDPTDAGAWVSLGLQYLNDDDLKNAKICFDRSCKYAGRAYLPFRERAYFYLRLATIDLINAHRRTSKSHNFNKKSEEMIKILQSMKLTLPKVNTGNYSISEDIVIPEDPE